MIDGRTAKCKAAGLIVLSMKGGGSIGGGRHKSCRAVSGQPPGGAWVLKCSEDDKGSKFKAFTIFFRREEAKMTKVRRPMFICVCVRGRARVCEFLHA